MAVTKIRDIDYRSSLHNPITDFYCESTDTKPTEGVETNALCYELDTMTLYYFTGTEWKEVGWNA